MSRVIEGIEKVLESQNSRLIVRNCNFNLGKEKQVIKECVKTPNSGLIIYPGIKEGKSNIESLKELKEKAYPFVLIDRFFKGLDTNYVGVDDFQGGYIATKHLLSLGHKRIACLSSVNFTCSSIRGRLEGYKRALAEENAPQDNYLVQHLHFSIDILEENVDEVRKLLTSWIQKENRPTAIFAIGDVIAIVILRIAFEMGLRIPEDISLVGFGDTDVAGLQTVPLTTIKIPMREIGMKAAEIILQKVETKKSVENKKIVLPVRLIVRKSCGARLEGYNSDHEKI